MCGWLRFNQLLQPEFDYYSGEWDRALGRREQAIETFEAGSPHHLEPNIRWTRALSAPRQRTTRRPHPATPCGASSVRTETKDQQFVLSALAVRLHLAIETAGIDDAADAAREILAGSARHAVRPPAVELARAAEVVGQRRRRPSLGGTYRVRLALDAKLRSRSSTARSARAADVFFQIGSLPDEALRAAPETTRAGEHVRAEKRSPSTARSARRATSARPRSSSATAQRFPRSACSRSIASKSDLKLPIPKPREPWRSITSKKSVGRSWTIFVKSCRR